MQRGYECGEVEGSRDRIVDGSFDGVLSVEPFVDGPGPWVAESWNALAQRCRYAQGQIWGEHGQPSVFLVDFGGGPVDAREADDHVFAESEDGIVGSRVWDRSDGEVFPLRELVGDETLYERQGYEHLVGMHSGGLSGCAANHAVFEWWRDKRNESYDCRDLE